MRALCHGRAVFLAGFLSALASAVLASAAGAGDLPSRASLWDTETQADTRLLAAVTAVAPGARSLDLGWQVALKGKWKTYWRAPGDAGLPPQLDWSGSTNLEAVTIDWPVPERMTVFGLDSYVYTHEVVLPLRVRLKTPGQAADLRLKVDYMVCEEVCVPLEARYRLYIPAGEAAPTAEAALIRDYEQRVPASHGPVRVTDVALDPNCGQPRMALSLGGGLPKGARLDAFVDGPDGVTYGRPQLSADGKRLSLPVHGLKAADPRAAEPVHVVLRPAAGPAVAWDGVPAAIPAQRTCAAAGS